MNVKIKRKIYGKDNCPFCEDKINDQIILSRGTYWTLLENKYPHFYGTSLLALPNRHIESNLELHEEEILSYKSEIEEKVNEIMGDKNYFSYTKYKEGSHTVSHLHIHFVEGIPIANNDEQTLEIQYNKLISI